MDSVILGRTTMMHRRHILLVATLLLEVLGLSVPADIALAQQMREKPQLKLSEVKPMITEYVDKMSRASKKRTGLEFSEEQKIELVDPFQHERSTHLRLRRPIALPIPAEIHRRSALHRKP